VFGVLKRKQKTHGTGLRVGSADTVDCALDFMLTKRSQDFSASGDSFGYFDPSRPWDQGCRVILIKVEHVRPGLAPDIEQVGKTSGRQQHDITAAPLQQGVGCHGSTMRELAEFGEI
jgi:hypothetical protein